MKRKSFIFMLLFFFTINQSWAIDYYEVRDSLKKEGLNNIALCSEQENKGCQLILGFAYLYGSEFRDAKLPKNIDRAVKLLAESTMLPYSRFLLGKIYLDSQGKNRMGIALMQSACEENIEEACAVSAEQYSSKNGCDKSYEFFDCKYDIDKSIKYEEKTVYLYNRKLGDKTLDKNRILLIKINILKYNIRLGELLIRNNDARGVSLLESINIDELDFDIYTLAHVYEEGKIVPQDLIKSYMYYDLTGGSEEEKARLSKKMTSAQVKEAAERSWNWQEQHHSYRPGYRTPANYDF